ncbi:alpha/beta hydrolase [Sporolactobacillus sp. KGMB 08714]|uniref:alpha/beta hydrolase n=1 Tax=Sporolactobacillus sp. KGMB 08714 TaxID=3064704 RepID=UPI002FBD6910
MQQELCILIHGFAGNPQELAPLAQALKQKGYEVITPLLPGHRMDRRRMEKITAPDWLHVIEDIVEHAIEEKKEIHLIGFSMGAMIASITACRYRTATLVLLSPSLYVLSPGVLKIRLKNFWQYMRKNHGLPPVRVILSNRSFAGSVPVHNLLQFQKIVRRAKRIFRRISVPVCIIHGRMDEIVDPKSSEWIFHTVLSTEKELHYLPHSKHHICHDSESGAVIKTVTAFLEKHHRHQ